MSEKRVTALEALVKVIDAAIEAAEPNVIASLSREKRQLLAELDSLSDVKGSSIDELTDRRTARRAASAVRAPADGGGKQRGKRSG